MHPDRTYRYVREGIQPVRRRRIMPARRSLKRRRAARPFSIFILTEIMVKHSGVQDIIYLTQYDVKIFIPILRYELECKCSIFLNIAIFASLNLRWNIRG